ncbi:MAG: class I SAM-dependent methyltransferase [Planctomycetes bacterium]|nr:class I SAM-dependent methyltransferase [Planctomycetota bacterium]
MVHVHVPRSKPITRVGRVLHNLAKFPARTTDSIGRWFAPQYRLEREALGEVETLLAPERRFQLESIEGMSSRKECVLLFSLALRAPQAGTIVEIGAWKGKSAAWLTEGSTLRNEPLPLVSIDPHGFGSWDAYQAVVREFELEQRGLTVMRTGSAEAGKYWKRPISLLWIDGDHDYEPVLADIDLFTPHVLPGAYVVFDDATTGDCPGVEQAIAERMLTNPTFQHIGPIRHLEVFQKLPA